MNGWMWRHGQTLEATLKSSVLRFVFNVWTSSWTHDFIYTGTCDVTRSKPASTWESKPPYYTMIMFKIGTGLFSCTLEQSITLPESGVYLTITFSIGLVNWNPSNLVQWIRQKLNRVLLYVLQVRLSRIWILTRKNHRSLLTADPHNHNKTKLHITCII